MQFAWQITGQACMEQMRYFPYLKPISNCSNIWHGCAHPNNLQAMSKVALPTAGVGAFSTGGTWVTFTSSISKLCEHKLQKITSMRITYLITISFIQSFVSHG